MKQLEKQQYDHTIHYWYEADLMTEHEYGLIFNIDTDTIPALVETIKKDIEADSEDNQHFWYFGRTLDDLILMVRYAHNQFIVQVNVKDFEFALCLDEHIGWKQEFLAQLTA
ncbi:hypothetical protein [Globicatella sanguinis]|uniref:hypothetical protein n=1 Tax=Globicatella sanguinis TaxID=13076 RepID=UPI0025432C9B|nr:hypothetical protein [Globicatella sanguinis]MDK7631492.1 hypothetical protein [Globicatella sanguinis]WIK67074.1 hypothetical protein CYJ72_002995 [Globicatella sanguinis]WKT56479.1 hypothetical protein Q3C38_02995 [Globicatella sanguinis]